MGGDDGQFSGLMAVYFQIKIFFVFGSKSWSFHVVMEFFENSYDGELGEAFEKAF